MKKKNLKNSAVGLVYAITSPEHHPIIDGARKTLKPATIRRVADVAVTLTVGLAAFAYLKWRKRFGK